jgi:TM2 domain-containing membrane protein YozV
MSEGGNLIPDSIAKDLPAMVRSELVKLSAQKQQEFVEEYRRKAKTVGAGYLLWFLFGCHYLYLGKWAVQIFFWITVGGLWIWWIVDLFRVPRLVRNYNMDVSVDVLRNLKALSGQG